MLHNKNLEDKEVLACLESLLRHAQTAFGRYVAFITLQKLKEGATVYGLSEEELRSIKSHRKWDKKFPRIKRVWSKPLPATSKYCPYCNGYIWRNARIVKVIQETPDIDFVLLVHGCGTAIRKYEDKRDIV